MVKYLAEFEYFYCVLENKNIIFKIRRSKVTDYVALRQQNLYKQFHSLECRLIIESSDNLLVYMYLAFHKRKKVHIRDISDKAIFDMFFYSLKKQHNMAEKRSAVNFEKIIGRKQNMKNYLACQKIMIIKKQQHIMQILIISVTFLF